MHPPIVSPATACTLAAEILDTYRDELDALGATELRPTLHRDNGRPGLTFTTHLLPFHPDGTRADQPVRMFGSILRDTAETWQFHVTYRQGHRTLTHFTCEGIFPRQLHRILRNLDHDGADTLANAA